MKKAKGPAANASLPIACGVGVLLALAVELLLILLSAFCINNEYCSINMIRYFAPAIQLISTFIGVYFTGKTAADKKTVVCIGVVAALIVLQLCSALLFFEGITANILVQIIAAVVALICGLLLVSRNKKSYSSRKKRMQHR